MSTLRRRLAIAAALFIAMTAVLARASADEAIPARQPFAQFPTRIGEWTGTRAADFDRRVLDVLGVDDYLNWTLTDPGYRVLGLYVGYWGSQRHGDTIHSPLNCLPGSGWQPISRRSLAIDVRGTHGPRTATVNRIVIEKGLDRQLVLYWYQSRDRVVASEYAGKVYTVLDAIRYHRSDAAIVRIVSPIRDASAAAEADAERVAAAFVQDLVPVLPGFLPL